MSEQPLTDDDIERTLLGVVSPPGDDAESASAEPGPSEYDMALQAVERSRDLASRRLSDLRAAREAINDEIRDLVTEVDLLTRMRRVADRPRLKGGE